MTLKEQNELNLTYINNKDFDGLLKANLRYIHFVVNQKCQDEEHFKDLVQCGSIGLFKAYETYNQQLNPIFIAYAKHYVLKEIYEYIDNQLDTIRIKSKYNSKYNIGLKSYNVISTNTKINGEDSDLTIEDTLYEENDTEVLDDRLSLLNRVISSLDEKEQELIKMFYGIQTKKLNQSEIS